MKPRKTQIRDIALHIINSPADPPVRSFEGLKLRTVEVLHQPDQASKGTELADSVMPGRYPREPELREDDLALLSEIYWDLVLDRVITPSMDARNREFYRFTIHSEYSPQRKGPA
ncbi:MAG: hypothetical protein WCK27_28535 [Verrucomicrobiota bacterium]